MRLGLPFLHSPRIVCVRCGDSPVSHLGTYISECFGVAASVCDYRMRHVRAYRWLTKFSETVGRLIIRLIIMWGRLCRVVRYSDDVSKARSYRSRVIWEEALARGIPMQQIVMFSLYTELFRARIRGTWHFFVSLPIPPQRDTVRGWVDDKHILKLHLRVAHVPVPLSDIASTEHHALAIFGKLNVPVVVKPRLGSRGRHTTTNVRDTSSLLKAFHSARLLCPHVSIEEQISGRVCRATVIGGTVRGFFEARAPHVVGDGILSIRALIDEKNLRRPDRVSEIVLTEEIESYLSSSGLSLLSVPKEGEDVMLTHRTGRLFGGETRELLSRVHPKLVQHLERAARAIDMSILGFDLVIEDPERDPDTQKWGIIEANTLPFIDLHYLPLYGTPSRPAEAVWDLWK